MPRLYLMRHAKSDWTNSLPDHARPLSARGRRAAPAMAAWMKAEGLVPELVLCSTAVRTRETWDLMAGSIGRDAAVIWEEELYGASAAGILDVLARVSAEADPVMVVGHNPGMEDLGGELAGSGDRDAVDRLRGHFPTAALAVLDTGGEAWDELGPGSCSLERFVRPKDLPEAGARDL